MDRNSLLVRVESVPTEWEASLLVQQLDEEGIRAKAIGGFTAGFLAESPGYVSVIVDSADETRARELVRRYFQRKLGRSTNDPNDTSESEFADESETDDEIENTKENLRSKRFWGFLFLLGQFLGIACTSVLLGSAAAAWTILGLFLLIIGTTLWIRSRLF